MAIPEASRTQPQKRYTLEQYLEVEEMLGFRTEYHDGLIIPVEDADGNEIAPDERNAIQLG